jgi:hypothetical protein
MILNISGIRHSLAEGEKQLAAKLTALLSLPEGALLSLKVLRKSLDARRSRPPFFIYVVEAVLADDIQIPAFPEGEISISVVHEREALAAADGIVARQKAIPSPRRRRSASVAPQVAVVGSGPAGLFAALTLAEKNIPVLLLERGKEVSARSRDVQAFWEKGELNGESNVHFGEGGAGAFSDGKLTSRIKNPRIRLVKETLVEAGAPTDILSDAKPHIGTDRLREVVENFRQRLLGLGCEIRFGARVSDFLLHEGRVEGLVVNGAEEIRVGRLILAMGQNAEDTYAKLRERGVKLEPKPFAMGLRVEHPQALINEIQYGKWRLDPALPPADYFLTAGLKQKDRSVYTFCMCPGGRIIGCSSEPGRVVTNGMSRYMRDSLYANSAVVVNVRTGDLPGAPQEPLKGLEFRRGWEEKAFALGGGNYNAPAQRLPDFLQDRGSDKLLPASFAPGIRAASLREALPLFVTEALQEGLRLFNRKMPGFITEEALLVGVETRTSSPVRILREASGQSVGTMGLYPCGEGAGYAGGIISSALDGIRAAESVIASPVGHQ